MSLTRREFMRLLAAASAAGMAVNGRSASAQATDYDVPAFGNLSLLHFTDCHAQLMPVHFREPNFNIGIGNAFGQPPHVVGEKFLEHFSIPAGSANAYAFTCLDFEAAAHKYGKVGGFAHLATLVKQLRFQPWRAWSFACCSMVVIPGKDPRLRCGPRVRIWLMPASCWALIS